MLLTHTRCRSNSHLLDLSMMAVVTPQLHMRSLAPFTACCQGKSFTSHHAQDRRVLGRGGWLQFASTADRLPRVSRLRTHAANSAGQEQPSNSTSNCKGVVIVSLKIVNDSATRSSSTS
jgi:hypothetical protein